MFQRLTALVFAVLTLGLSACTTMVDFTSSPPGATVVYDGKPIGVTPFTAGVSDRFGWYSVYSFQADLDCHFSRTFLAQEATPFDHNNAVPAKVHFDMRPTPCNSGPKSRGLDDRKTGALNFEQKLEEASCKLAACPLSPTSLLHNESGVVVSTIVRKCPGDPRCTIQKYTVKEEVAVNRCPPTAPNCGSNPRRASA